MRKTSWQILLLLLTALSSFGQRVIAQDYPSKPLKLVVAQAPGVSVDLVARIMATEMGKYLGQPVIVENKPGASNQIGYEYVARQMPADGYTMAMVSVETLAVLPATVKNPRVDSLKDLQLVIGLVQGRYAFGSSPKFPWKSFQELIGYAKANPGKINYSSPSPVIQLSTELFVRDLGLNVVFVPFSAAPPAYQAIISGDVQMGLTPEVTAMSFGDKFRPLAVTGSQRSSIFPDVPTFSELGYPQVPGINYSLGMRAGTPPSASAKIYAAALKALHDNEVKAQFTKIHFETVALDGDAAQKNLVRLVNLFTELGKKIGLQPE